MVHAPGGAQGRAGRGSPPSGRELAASRRLRGAGGSEGEVGRGRAAASEGAGGCGGGWGIGLGLSKWAGGNVGLLDQLGCCRFDRFWLVSSPGGDGLALGEEAPSPRATVPALGEACLPRVPALGELIFFLFFSSIFLRSLPTNSLLKFGLILIFFVIFR
jgi:hypothetical protein